MMEEQRVLHHQSLCSVGEKCCRSFLSPHWTLSHSTNISKRQNLIVGSDRPQRPPQCSATKISGWIFKLASCYHLLMTALTGPPASLALSLVLQHTDFPSSSLNVCQRTAALQTWARPGSVSSSKCSDVMKPLRPSDNLNRNLYQ